MKRACALLAVSSVLASQGAAAADKVEKLVLAPSSAWVVDYGSESCALQRNYGEGDNKVFMEIRTYNPSLRADWQALVATQKMAPVRGPVEYAFAPFSEHTNSTGDVFDVAFETGYKGRVFPVGPYSGEESSFEAARQAFLQTTSLLTEEERALAGSAPKIANFRSVSDTERKALEAYLKGWGLFYGSKDYSNARASWLTSISGFEVKRGYKRPFELQLGSMDAPLKAMRTCLDDLMKSWGIDAERYHGFSRHASIINSQELAEKLDFPMTQLMRGNSDRLSIRLDISADGKVTGCHSQMSVNHESFRQKACEGLMQYAKVEPALDADGKPVASFVIRWIGFSNPSG